MLNFLVMLSVGLRMALFLAAVVSAVLYSTFYWQYTRAVIGGRDVEPNLRNAAAYVPLALGFFFFLGNRIWATLVLHQPLDFDHNEVRAALTCLGFALCFCGVHMSTTARLQRMGLARLAARVRAAKIVISVAFAIFYAARHGIL